MKRNSCRLQNTMRRTADNMYGSILQDIYMYVRNYICKVLVYTYVYSTYIYTSTLLRSSRDRH